MAVELKTRGLPVEGLDPYIMSVGKTQNLEVIQKIRQVCEPLIMELIQNHLKELKAYTGIFDFEVQITTNANRETEKLIEGKVQELESFWEENKLILESKGFKEDDYWTCVEWVPTRVVASLCEGHKI